MAKKKSKKNIGKKKSLNELIARSRKLRKNIDVLMTELQRVHKRLDKL